MEQYHELLKEIIQNGNVEFEPRTKTYTLGISSGHKVYDLRKGFPLMTTKNVPPRLPFEELFWKLRGERNVKSLVDRNIHIWTGNAFDRYLKTNGLTLKYPKHTSEWNEEFEIYSQRILEDSEFANHAGDLGPVYGYQWRHWSLSRSDGFFPQLRDAFRELFFGREEKDQLVKLLADIKKNPGSRYHTLSAWNVGDLNKMALGPCPFWHQFTVYGDNLDLTMVQRSCDTYLGVPFNIAQDSLLAHLVAQETGLKPRFFNHHTLNTHLYLGVSPRADFWNDEKNVREFKGRFSEVEKRIEYLDLKDWYLSVAPEESKGNERKDHMPFVLEQLSKLPGDLPSLEIVRDDISLLEMIELNPLDCVDIKGYNPCKWDAKATMAA